MKLFLITLLLVANSSPAQYAIDWFSIDGGGGQSAGGPYTLTGTLGQLDAATSAGQAYTLQGGFWSAFAVVQTEGAPTLRIYQDGANVTLAWPSAAAGYQLQEALSLSPPEWKDVIAVPATLQSELRVNQTLQQGTRFFRLRKP